MRLDSDSKSDEPPSGFKSVRCCVGEQKVGQALVKKDMSKKRVHIFTFSPQVIEEDSDTNPCHEKENKQTNKNSDWHLYWDVPISKS